MNKNTTIVAGINESVSAPAALRYATHLAQSRGARLMLAHVVPQVVRAGAVYEVSLEHLESSGRQLLSDAARLAEQTLGTERVSTGLLHGTAVNSLVRAAELGDAIVLGTDERSSMERLGSGSTLIGVSTHCAVPVFVVPATWSTEPAERPIITVGVRDISSCHGLIATAFEIAEQHHGDVRVVHASGLPPAEGLMTSAEADLPSVHLRDLLAEATAAVQAEHPQVASEVRFVHGRPSAVLGEESATSDLLVLERRPHVLHAHLGRTGRALIKAGRCPIVVVPPAGVTVPERAVAAGNPGSERLTDTYP
ncbi:universal stress protein [Nocardioides nematodiphilus]|uniref:universal stress protein n=1 Tax=Nocardioides nematodiphilus TaxID=2849669 RepID=UPI001CD98887|nr:universal stress protein [Nocardioides nematodiphilus]MCA1981868.1 universal stress protein [Nocardioides nematodiphilus]